MSIVFFFFRKENVLSTSNIIWRHNYGLTTWFLRQYTKRTNWGYWIKWRILYAGNVYPSVLPCTRSRCSSNPAPWTFFFERANLVHITELWTYHATHSTRSQPSIHDCHLLAEVWIYFHSRTEKATYTLLLSQVRSNGIKIAENALYSIKYIWDM